MGNAGHKLQHYLERIEEGDDKAIDKLWDALDKDGSGALEGHEAELLYAALVKELQEGWDELPPERQSYFAKTMMKYFVRAKMDPRHEGRVTKNHFKEHLLGILNEEL
mmetsp:Transcript_55746/g.128047  ORF Transcript_55746/g.128047 Transcript_55746/m.128047 type:complete len:108 (-) Transcript_55746:128-451(-)